FQRTRAQDHRTDRRSPRGPLDRDLRHADAFSLRNLLHFGDDFEIARRELVLERRQATLFEQSQAALALAVRTASRRPVLAGQESHAQRAPRGDAVAELLR